MNAGDVLEVIHAVRLIRDQIWRGYLTTEGLQSSRHALEQWRPELAGTDAPELDWVLTLIDDELLARELDGAVQ